MGRAHRYRGSHFNCTCVVCTSCASHSSHRSTRQCEWWRDQDLWSEDGHIHHSQSGHECHVSHCARCRESHRRSWCTSSKWGAVSSVSKWQGLSSAEKSKSSASLLQESQLFLRSGHSRVHQRFNYSVEDSEHTVLNSQSTNRVIAEIDFEVNSESRLKKARGEEDDSNQEANPAQCFEIPETISAAERAVLTAAHAVQVMVYCLSTSQRSAALSQIKPEGFEHRSTSS